ncbi:MAG: ABC transporter ATP-binding protein [Deltaproteobacteria bacterium]|nr:ABC transporter ATP-binding protein [Deltaproteobacteria bacterium]
MITVENLTKKYGDKTAVDGISFQIEQGEIFGLLGPNGAGKTTTIHMMVSALKPDAGTVSMAPSPDASSDTAGGGAAAIKDKAMVGIAPQALAIYDELTGEENVTFFAKLQGLTGKKLKTQVDWALAFTGLDGRRKDRAGAYSGGMKRRLNLACAIVHEPKVLLLDEPTVGVDPQSRNHLFDNIEALRDRGWTILYTTHYMEEAQRLCDRVAIMDHGKILALDRVWALIETHGGQSMIVVDLNTPPKDPSALLAQLTDSGLEDATLVDRTVRSPTNHPLDDITKLAGLSLDVATFRVDRPNLEAVFLNLTGRTLRD